MRGRPEEADAAQEAEIERRVAHRGQAAADIRDQKDEKDESMGLLAAEGIGPQHRADQQHRRPRGAHQAGQHRANRQQRRVGRRRADQRSLEQHPAPGRVERQQQRDEGHVFQHHDMGEFVPGAVDAEDDGCRHQQQHGPAGGDLAVMVVPDMPGKQRHQRDGQQDADEGNGPDQGHLRPRHAPARCEGHPWHQGRHGRQATDPRRSRPGPHRRTPPHLSCPLPTPSGRPRHDGGGPGLSVWACRA